jgi:NAD(P)-dependent dehydrogenase (short-subunit alcohol dehydrogenase family)
MSKAWSANDIPTQSGRRAVVTGATSGIGFHTALELARAGADVIVAARDTERGRDAVARIVDAVPTAAPRVAAWSLDLADLASVRAFAARLVERGGALDLLVNNAGIMALPTRETTVDGFEKQFGTNHLGHFALTGLVLPLLQASRAARVVTVSSSMSNFARVDLDDLQSEKRYTPMGTYGQTKLANLLFMLELERRALGPLSAAAHPGASITGLQKHRFARLVKLFGQPASEGALPTLFAATAADAAGGGYYGPSQRFGMVGPPKLTRLPRRAFDAEVARALWERSEQLTGVHFPAARVSAGGPSARKAS